MSDAAKIAQLGQRAIEAEADRDRLKDQLAALRDEIDEDHAELNEHVQAIGRVTKERDEAIANGLRLAEELERQREMKEIAQRDRSRWAREIQKLRPALESIANGHLGMERDPAQHCTDLVRRARQALEGSE